MCSPPPSSRHTRVFVPMELHGHADARGAAADDADIGFQHLTGRELAKVRDQAVSPRKTASAHQRASVTAMSQPRTASTRPALKSASRAAASRDRSSRLIGRKVRAKERLHQGFDVGLVRHRPADRSGRWRARLRSNGRRRAASRSWSSAASPERQSPPAPARGGWPVPSGSVSAVTRGRGILQVRGCR